VCNAGRTVVGLMPHPERATDPLTGSVDGLVLRNGLLRSVAPEARPPATATVA
jgi:phosphoribosylformylglycinamidine synthase